MTYVCVTDKRRNRVKLSNGWAKLECPGQTYE